MILTSFKTFSPPSNETLNFEGCTTRLDPKPIASFPIIKISSLLGVLKK